MKPIPRPLKELSIEVTANIVFLYTASQDARYFVIEHAAKFGQLHIDGPNSNRVVLFVSPSFDVKEVADYFESYNDEGTDEL